MCGAVTQYNIVTVRAQAMGSRIFSGQRFRIRGKKNPRVLWRGLYTSVRRMKDLRGEVMSVRVCIVHTTAEMAIHNKKSKT
jgi:hypothetical protein